MWEDTTLGNSSVGEEVGELLIISDGEEDESWGNSLSSVVFGGVSGELKDLSAEVLHDGGDIDWSTGTNSGAVSAVSHVSGDSSDWEGDSSSGGSGSSSASTFTFTFSFSSWHFCVFNVFGVICFLFIMNMLLVIAHLISSESES